MQFIPTFGQYSPLKLSESYSALLLTALTGSYAAGRFLGIFISMAVHPLIMLLGNLVLCLVGNIILLLYASENLVLFWIAAVTMGFGLSTMYASYIAFIEKHIIFTDGVGAFLIVSGSPVAAIYPLIVGERIAANVRVLTYTNFFSIGACLLVVIVGFALTRGKSVRH